MASGSGQFPPYERPIYPPHFRTILDLAHGRFEVERKSYFLDCEPSRVPGVSGFPDEALPPLMEQFDPRQLLHVTFGSALERYGTEIRATLREYRDSYETVLLTHFRRHLASNR